ncbi:MAG: type I-B CRISPR-associated protein Cas7/Csh2 [Thermosphaera sp.]
METEQYRLNNSEILFIYEARLCNPNGDPDYENRPRIDRKTGRNLVSDVRLKRFFRNYITAKFGEDYIWVSTVESKHVRADERLEKISKAKSPEDVLKACIDARLFGATIPIGKGDKEARGKSYAYIGPVQFTWGYSLHPVEVIDSSTITSIFMGRPEEEEAERYGTIGKDWRVYYSLIAFYGVVSGHRAASTKVKHTDIMILDNLLYKSLILDATTRSKIGHWPHLYLRIEYSHPDILIGDLRKYIDAEFDKDKPIRDLKDIHLNFNRLMTIIGENKNDIRHALVYESEDFEKEYQLKRNVGEIIGNGNVKPLPHDINVDAKLLRL